MSKIDSFFHFIESRLLKSFAGVFYGVLATISNCLCLIPIKFTSYGTLEIAYYRTLFATIVGLAMIRLQGEEILPKKEVTKSILKGILSVFGSFTFILAILYERISIYSIISTFSIVQSVIAGRIFFKEKINAVKLFCTGLIMLGIYLTVFQSEEQPGEHPILGFVLSLVSVTSLSSILVFARYVGSTLSVPQSSFHSSFIPYVLFSILLVSFGNNLSSFTLKDTALMAFSGVFFIGKNAFWARALALEDVSIISIVNNMLILWNYLADFLVFGSSPTFFELLGVFLVVSANAIINLHKKYSKSEKDVEV